MNHLENFKRSINIWKVSDKEKEVVNIYVDMYLWMSELFKDLGRYTTYDYPLSIFYGTSIDNILIEQDLENDYNFIHPEKVYYVFLSKYSSYISKYQDNMSIFQEYLVNTLELKGNRTSSTRFIPKTLHGNISHLGKIDTNT